MSYAVYLRKSRADLEAESHGEGETLSRHKAALLELARKKRLTIGAIYEEIVSGETIAARPQMQKLLAEVGSGKWDGVLVMEIERLARGDTMDQGLVAQTFKFSGTKIITPLKTFDPANEFDEEYFEFGLFMARREFTAINRRLVRGREASAKEGKYVGSIAPYGYKKVKLENDKGYTLEINEEQAKIVRMIFDWYINGTEINGIKKRLGLHAIAKRLNELGIRTGSGNDFWTIYGVRNMLSNPVYIGKIRWGFRKAKKIVTPDGQKKKVRESAKDGEYIVVDGLHEAIISEDVFCAAQSMISENVPAPTKYKNALVNPFAGLLYCAKCGHALTYRPPTGRQTDAYIGCNTAGCKCVAAPFKYVEQRVLSILNEWVSEYSAQKSEAEQEDKLSLEIENALAQTDLQIKAYRSQLDKIYDFLERGVYTEEVFKQRSSAIERQIEELEQKTDMLNSEYALVEERKKVRVEFAPTVAHLLTIYDDIDAGEKNRLLKLIIQRIIYEKDVNGQNHKISPDCFKLGVLPRLPKKGD